MADYPVNDGAASAILGSDKRKAGTFEVTGQSGAVQTTAGSAKVGIQIWGTFVATVALEKSYDGGATWHEITTYTAADDQIYEELEGGTQFRFNCTDYTSGTVNYRLTTR